MSQGINWKNNALQGLITTLSFPVLLLNLFGGFVSGIWLLIIGDWRLVIGGIVAGAVSTFIIGIILIPSMILDVPMNFFLKKGKLFGAMVFAALSNFYIVNIIAIWCYGILLFFFQKATFQSYIPMLIWSYGVAMTPWAYMASKEPGGFASITTFMAELAYIFTIFIIIFNGGKLFHVIIAFMFWFIMLISWTIQMSVGYKALKEEIQLQKI
jgi:hypothetical protein